jgi:thioredoxin reductase
MTSINVAIIGAGPYGLSVTASLRAAGVSCRAFGRPMETWRKGMPAGMQLKSDGFASNLSVPMRGGTLADYCKPRAIPYDDESVLVHLTTFVDYGLDFQSRHVPDLDQRDAVSVARDGTGFVIELEDGTRIKAERVVLAVGVTHFAYVPDVLRELPEKHVTHSSAHRDFSGFAGKDVTVVGAGSSAVEVAAMLDSAGAKPRLLARSGEIRFNSASTERKRTLWDRVRHPKSGLGPGMTSWLCCTFPQLYRMLSPSRRMAVLRSHLGPKSLYHFRERISRVAVLLKHEIERCTVVGNGLEIQCRDETGKTTTLRTDHLIAATGYAARMDRLLFLSRDLRDAVRTHEGYPILSANFESSVPGLYFVGLAAAGTFGPLMRFVYGARFAARRLVAHLT